MCPPPSTLWSSDRPAFPEHPCHDTLCSSFGIFCSWSSHLVFFCFFFFLPFLSLGWSLFLCSPNTKRFLHLSSFLPPWLQETRNKKMCPGNSPLPISHCPHPRVKLLFSTELPATSLFPAPARVLPGRGCSGGWAGWQRCPFSPAPAPRNASLSPPRARPWETGSRTVTMGYTNITSI